VETKTFSPLARLICPPQSSCFMRGVTIRFATQLRQRICLLKHTRARVLYRTTTAGVNLYTALFSVSHLGSRRRTTAATADADDCVFLFLHKFTLLYTQISGKQWHVALKPVIESGHVYSGLYNIIFYCYVYNIV